MLFKKEQLYYGFQGKGTWNLDMELILIWLWQQLESIKKLIIGLRLLMIPFPYEVESIATDPLGNNGWLLKINVAQGRQLVNSRLLMFSWWSRKDSTGLKLTKFVVH